MDIFPILSRELQKLRKPKKDGNLLKESLYTSWYSPYMPITEPRNFTEDLMKGYMDNPEIYSIINKIADTASSIQLSVVDKDGEPIEGHWTEDLLSNPNEDTTFKELLYNYYVYLLAIGNSFMYSPKIEGGKVTEIWTMPSDLVLVVSGAFYEPISGYKFKEGNQEIIFPKEEVMHSKLFNPRFNSGSWVYGLSPISVASEIISSMNAGTKAMESSFENMGPPYIISSQMPEGLTQEQQEMLEATYKKKYGVQNAGKPMLTGTPVKVERLGVSPVDLNIIEGSQYGLKVLCNVYGVDSGLFNDKDAATYNNLNQIRKDFITYTIKPLNDLFAQKLKQFLVPDEQVRFQFNYDDLEVMQESIYTRADALAKMDYLTPNEKREAVGFSPIDDPEMDEVKSYVPEFLEPETQTDADPTRSVDISSVQKSA